MFADAALVKNVAILVPVGVKCKRARDPCGRMRNVEWPPTLAAVLGPPVLDAVRKRERLAIRECAGERDEEERTMRWLTGCGMTISISPRGRSFATAQLLPSSSLTYVVPCDWS
jgi:hypothetical protein